MYPDSARALALVGCILFGLIALSGMSGGRGVSASGSKKGTNGRASLVLIAAILVILGAVVPASLSPGHFGLNTVVALSLCGSVLGGIALFIGRLNGHPVLRSPLAGGAFVLAATALALPGELRGATPLVGGLSAVGIVLAALTCTVGLLSFRRVLRRDDGGQFALLLSFGLLFGGLIVPWGGVLGELRPFSVVDGLTHTPIKIPVEVQSLNGGGAYETLAPLVVGHETPNSLRLGVLGLGGIGLLIWALQWARPSRVLRLAHFFSLFGVGGLALLYLGVMLWNLASGSAVPAEELSTWGDWLEQWVTHSSSHGAFRVVVPSLETPPLVQYGFQTSVAVWFAALSTIPLWCISAAYRVRSLTSPIRNQEANSERRALVNAESSLSVWVVLAGVIWLALAGGIGFIEQGAVFLADSRIVLAVAVVACAAIVLTETARGSGSELRSQIAGLLMAFLGLLFLVGPGFGWTARSIYMVAVG